MTEKRCPAKECGDPDCICDPMKPFSPKTKRKRMAGIQKGLLTTKTALCRLDSELNDLTERIDALERNRQNLLASLDSTDAALLELQDRVTRLEGKTQQDQDPLHDMITDILLDTLEVSLDEREWLSENVTGEIIKKLNIRREWGLVDNTGQGSLADTREELNTDYIHETESVKYRYITDWKPE